MNEEKLPVPPFRLSILSSSHQDIAWMDSPEACMKYRDESCITPALEMMRTHPDYRFVMENMLNLLEYLERHPDRKEEIARLTREGRMEWGATFTQPYESLLSGEQLVRQVYFGRRWIIKNLAGCDARVYFNPDVPGRALQMQQILSKAGIPFMVISRYHEGFYRWKSPDGSSVLAYSPGHYGNSSALLNAEPDEALKAIAAKLLKWKPYYDRRGIAPEFPLLHSEDFSKPRDYRPLIGLWNARYGGGAEAGAPGAPSANLGSRMAYASARGFFEALSRGNPRFDEVMGERPNLWLYIHGPTHHDAITAQREAGSVLPAAETFAAAAALLEGSFTGYPARELNEAWQAAVYPDHGWGGKEGQITDRLFRKKYEFARNTGERWLGQSLKAIASRIKTSPDKGLPVIVFNDLSWMRSGPVLAEDARSKGPFVISDASGKVEKYQVLPPAEGQSPDKIRVQFIARDVPSVGYKTYYIAAGEAVKTPPPAGVSEVYENTFYRLRFAPGGLAGIFDKELGRELLRTEKFLGFEVFTMQSVGNGAGEFGRVQKPTMGGFDKLSLHMPAWARVDEECGPLQEVFRFRQPLSDCVVEETIIVHNAVKRIDCRVALLGWDGSPYREFRLAVPVDAPGGEVAYEVPMGVVEAGKSEAKGTGGPAYGSLVYDQEMSEIRPREVQNFLSVSDAALGVTLTTSVAVNDDTDPTDEPAGYPILQGLLLASRRSCHGQGNWYLQEGDHHFRFSLTSHAPGWRNGYKAGIEPHHPLRAVAAPASGGAPALPEEASLFSLSSDHVLISTVKKAEDEDAVVIRCYDIEGRDAETTIRSVFPWIRAQQTNIIEDDGKPLALGKDGPSLKVGHHAIETVKLFPAVKKK